MINRFLNQDGVAFFGQCAYGDVNSENDTGCLNHPFRLCVPDKPFREPAAKDFEIFAAGYRIAEDSVLAPFNQSVNHAGWCRKIHVRYPKRKNILWFSLCGSGIELHGAGISAISYFVKIILPVGTTIFHIETSIPVSVC